MNKYIQLELWKLYLIFLLPIVFMIILTIGGIGEEQLREQYNMQFYTIFGTLCFLLIFLWHYFMGISFFKETNGKGFTFKINGLIPVLFYTILFLYSIYGFGIFLNKREELLSSVGENVARPVDLGIISIAFNVLLLHSIISLFVNNNLIAKNLRKIENRENQKFYYEKYLKPMRVVVKNFIIILVLSFVVAVFSDLL